MKTVPDQHNQKNQLRKELRAKRVQIGANRRAALDAIINRQLVEYARRVDFLHGRLGIRGPGNTGTV